MIHREKAAHREQDRERPRERPGIGESIDRILAPSIALDGVTKDFGPRVRALDDVSMTVFPGEVVTLLGLSGSGKSTLLRLLNGLHVPTGGTVSVLGQDVGTARGGELRALRRKVGFVFQQFHLVGSMSALENVCAGALGSLRGPRIGLLTYPRSVRLAAMEQLDRVGLADQAFQRADTLSGGQQQRVAVARALVQRPRILLADEPVASLDPESSAQVMALISRVASEDDLTVLCSLHQVELALSFGHRLIGLRAGKMVLDKPVSSIGKTETMSIYSSVAAASAPQPV
ncbi:phosphonate ABC transporter ATP-binding protein [Rhodococcus triatomae]|uniref:Phosphonate transport system ATP-binding protein n=1 Tax=Rhodococcus triatomae TaxID=300028 RepID=A0A1G8LJB0_9NOCA|nr:phosphonate ABC transporter ATP-binding protein [Rhodococcus triatomae]QNG20605.1 phosphonate ABC transporter ATP-binding protein [Rhodococcus triatomae]QNG23477.1 phosphonate ABC transporter ATP-binding protein [Rhodococcus triatomae]SDI55756.1 phosphonate transport system ATP-binding protein [Rhodococcus triatomae]